MEWRCEWCGKPHAENDPPCDNCGHGSFEEAVVRQTDLSEGGGPESTTVWVCTECGRNHTKHAPPCSRCGNHELVTREQRVDETELEVPGYIDLLTPRYALGLIVAVGLAVVFVLGLAGVVALPGFGTDVPEVSDVPGDAVATGSYDLADVEAAYLEQIDEQRAATGAVNLTRSERLDEVATFYNQRRVKADYGDGTLPDDGRLRELIGDTCEGQILRAPLTADGSEHDSARTLGEAFATSYLASGGSGESVGEKTGVDIHAAPDGTVYLTQFVC